MIEYVGVSRSYGNRLAVDDLHLEIAPGELFAFLGPNGAGKTTTMKMAVGLLRPNQGLVKVCGHDVAREPRAAKSKLSYVPDEPHLYDKLTGREFLQFISEMYGIQGTAETEKQIEQFEIASFVDELTETYSHGMKQRLVFASAFLHHPDVLVVDEPMVGLDPKSIRLVKDLLREQARCGTTVFMSTHTLAVAEEIGDRIGILLEGKLQFVGTLAALKEECRQHHSSLEEMFLELTRREED
ncbi:MAG: ABC transporter ATP-binding protein [Planctomycetales bacterium]